MTDPQSTKVLPDRHRVMLKMIAAAMHVRDGMWMNGAPTHLIAEYLTELEAIGLTVVPASESIPREVAEGLARAADALGAVGWPAGAVDGNDRVASRQAADWSEASKALTRALKSYREAVPDERERTPDGE